MVPDTFSYYPVANKVKYLTLVRRNLKLCVLRSEVSTRLLRINEDEHWTVLRLVSKLWSSSPSLSHTHPLSSKLVIFTHLFCFLGTFSRRFPGK
jgi:hypothetical protein